MQCKKLTDCSPCTFHELNTVKECHHTGPMRQDSAARILQGDITPSFQPSVVALHYRHPLSSLLPIHQTPVYDSRVEDTEFQQGLKSHCHWHTRETN